MDERAASFTRLYEQFYPRVLAYALRRVAPDQAREVADESFLIAWRRLSDIPEPPLPWLLVTARNILLAQLRGKRRQDALSWELARCLQGQQLPSTEAGVVERVTVLTALAQLPVRDREALMLTVWDGLSHADAAAVAGCKTATFSVRLHRARRRLAAALDRLDRQAGKGTVPVGDDVAVLLAEEQR